MTRKTALVAFSLVGLACLTIELNRQGRPVAGSGTASSALSSPDDGSDMASTVDDLCGANCSVFDAGYGWAEENEIANEEICDREAKRFHSASFADGCKQYIHAMRPED